MTLSRIIEQGSKLVKDQTSQGPKSTAKIVFTSNLLGQAVAHVRPSTSTTSSNYRQPVVTFNPSSINRIAKPRLDQQESTKFVPKAAGFGPREYHKQSQTHKTLGVGI